MCHFCQHYQLFRKCMNFIKVIFGLSKYDDERYYCTLFFWISCDVDIAIGTCSCLICTCLFAVESVSGYSGYSGYAIRSEFWLLKVRANQIQAFNMHASYVRKIKQNREIKILRAMQLRINVIYWFGFSITWCIDLDDAFYRMLC